MTRGLNSQNSLLLWKLYWNRWQAMSFIRGRWYCVCRTKQGRKLRALWGISWYSKMCNAFL